MLDRLRPSVAREPLRRTAVCALAVATLAAPASLAFRDAGDPSEPVRVESDHEPGRCAFTHDHAACLLVLASAPRPGASAPLLPGPAAPDATGVRADRELERRPPSGPPLPARGPPSLPV